MEHEGEKKGRARFVVMNFVRVLLVVAIIGAYINQRWLIFIVAIISFAVTLLPKILYESFGVLIPIDLEVMIILFVYGTLLFGESRGYFSQFWWVGIIVNVSEGIALGIVGLTILFALYKNEQLEASPAIIALFSFCFALAIGTLWEFFEFGMDNLFGFYLQKESLVDTMLDLAFDAFGGLIVSIAGYNYLKGGSVNLISKQVLNFIEKNPFLFKGTKKESLEEKVKKIIREGEKDKIEFKSTLRTNLHSGGLDKKIEHSVLKTVCAFLNSHGGTILIGVSDDKKVCGIEKDNFANEDKSILHLTNLIKSHLGKEFFHFIKVEVIKIDEKGVILVECEKSDKPAFLKFNQIEEYYIRSGPASVKLDGSSLVDYVHSRFKDN